MASSRTSPNPRFFFSLDTPKAVPLNFRESYIRGWFVPDDDNAYELWLSVDGARVRAFTGLPRPDVLRHHKSNPAFKNSGFLIRFSRPKLPEPLKLIAVATAGELVLAEGIPVPRFGGGKRGLEGPGINASYQEWLATSEPFLFAPEEEIASRIASMSYRPLISIILPIPESHVYLVTRCIESILQQHYRQWQLCIVSGSSKPTRSREYLEKLASEDDRLRLVITESGSIPELCARAFDLAQGEFVLRLDHRDELQPFALMEIVSSLNSGGVLDVVYADEDEMDFYGSRLRPFLKPDFDPEAFLSWNFIGNIAAVRRTVLLSVKGYRTGADGPDDWDTMLRVLETVGSSRFRHIPKPLYHLRKGDDAVAPLPRELHNHSAKAINHHLARMGTKATVEPGLFPGSFRLRYENAPDCRIAVLVRSEDGGFQHAALAANVNRRTTRIYESRGASAVLLSDINPTSAAPGVRYTVQNLSEMPEDVFVFVNRPLDTVSHFFFEELAAQAMREDCGLATGISLDRTGRILHSGFRCKAADEMTDEFAGIHFSEGELLRNLSVVRSVDSISDEFFAVKRTQLVALGWPGATFNGHTQQLVKRLAKSAHLSKSHVLVTPYAVATFDIAHVSACPGRARCSSRSPSRFNGNAVVEDASKSTNPEMLARVGEIDSERNHLHREQGEMEQTIAGLETDKYMEVLQQQIRELNTALEAERRVQAGIQNSLSWKLTSPLRACMRFIRQTF